MRSLVNRVLQKGLRHVALFAMTLLPTAIWADTPSANSEMSGFHETFLTASDTAWSIANYQFSHPGFDTDWARDRVKWKKTGGAELTLRPKTGAENRFDGGSMRRSETSHYGRYEVTMQPAKGDGIITGFFTYTGSYYGTRHDEIDIEFLGKDTTKLHAAWFVDGVLTNRFVDLGFDAADRPRRYAFEWRPDSIRWYAEGRLVFEANAADGPLPQIPGYLFLNIWAADKSISNWSGVAVEGAKASAIVKDVRFVPFDQQVAAAFPETRGLAETSATTVSGGPGSVE